MSALARFFNMQGKVVIGYDKTQTVLTNKLVSEGINIHFEDLGEKVLKDLNEKHTLVVYTPAIPNTHQELNAFQKSNFIIIKRAKALGIISEEQDAYAVAGTHGKTTTSSIMAHVLYNTKESTNAFIGGITTNYNSNCLIAEQANRVVVEADEFDRSFLQLSPKYSVITSMDADHLDIYGEAEVLENSFIEFAERTDENGLVFVQSDLNFDKYNGKAKVLSYGFNGQNSDWQAERLNYKNGTAYFDVKNHDKLYSSVEFGLPGKHNAENALAVFGLLIETGISEEVIREGFRTYTGVKRRFEYHLKHKDLIIIDDYAHHPSEITAFLNSVKEIYPNKKITAVFQPHLFSRTQDFMSDFRKSLSICDRLYLLDIYPARELPIPGVTSQVLLNGIKIEDKQLSSKENIVKDLSEKTHEIIVIIGAGDIDTTILPITNAYKYE